MESYFENLQNSVIGVTEPIQMALDALADIQGLSLDVSEASGVAASVQAIESVLQGMSGAHYTLFAMPGPNHNFDVVSFFISA